jgi:hypothetical protein
MPRGRVCCTSQKQSFESVEAENVQLQWQNASPTFVYSGQSFSRVVGEVADAGLTRV